MAETGDSLAWMAWTWQTGVFFALLAAALLVMTALAILRPSTVP